MSEIDDLQARLERMLNRQIKRALLERALLRYEAERKGNTLTWSTP